MKRSFSLLELIFAIVILSFIFSTSLIFYQQIYKNYEPLGLFERLYKLEEKLFKAPNIKEIILQTDSLNKISLSEKSANDGLFEFKMINPKGQEYRKYFYDEKDF